MCTISYPLLDNIDSYRKAKRNPLALDDNRAIMLTDFTAVVETSSIFRALKDINQVLTAKY